MKIFYSIETNVHARLFYLLPSRMWVPRDHTQPGFFFRYKNEPVNKVDNLYMYRLVVRVQVSPICSHGLTFVQLTVFYLKLSYFFCPRS